MPESYPIYRRSQYHFYKIYSKDEAIQVFKGYQNGIQVVSKCNALYSSETLGNIPSTESEFLDAYDYVRNQLDKIAL